jgi:hypothetical protein
MERLGFQWCFLDDKRFSSSLCFTDQDSNKTTLETDTGLVRCEVYPDPIG